TSLFATVLGAPAATIDATPLAATGTHLWVIANLRGTTAATAVDCQITVNNDSAANYDRQQVSGAAAVAAAAESFGSNFWTAPNMPAASDAAGLFGGFTLYIPLFLLTTANKWGILTSVKKSGTASGNLNIQAHGA